MAKTISDIEQIQALLKKNASAEVRTSIQKFVPGSTKIYGVKNPVLNDLAVAFKSGGFELVETLWKSGAYEERLIAAKMIRKIAVKDPAKAIQTVKRFSSDIDNWAVCDTLGMQSLKPINKKYAEEIFALAERFSTSKNTWQKRLSLVLVEDFTKQKAFHPRIKKLIAKQENEKEYYVKKAVEWINRNVQKGS